MDGIVAYILSKKFTKDTVIGMGAIKGAPCQVQGISKVGKTTTITLKWEDNVGGTHTQAFDVEDGADGVSVANATINASGNLILTLSDGNDIDCGKVLPQYDTMPTPSLSLVGAIYQYIGTTTSTYTKGYFYECINDGGVYKWVNTNIQDSYTKTEIGDLTNLPDNTKNVVENIEQLKLSIDQLSASKLSISDIDNALSNVSENPVQNKVITLAIDQLRGSILSALNDKEDRFRVTAMPIITASDVGKIVQYIGDNTSALTKGYYYIATEVSTGVYDWVQKNVQPSGGSTGGDGTVDGYYNSADQLFYEEIGYVNPITGAPNTLYVSLDTDLLYRYDSNTSKFIRVDNSSSGEDDVIDGYYNTTNHKFYEEPTYITEIVGQTGKIYISDDTNIQYRWDGTQFVTISSSIDVDNALSTTSENPVQNKVITARINDLQASKLSLSDVDNALSGTSLYPVQNKVVSSAIDQIQLTINQLQGSVLTKIQKKLAANADDFAIFTNDGDIADSGISKDIIPTTASISNKLLVGSDLSVKADKVVGATNDDIALLDSAGNLKDSNKKLSDFIPATEKGAHSGVAELDSTGKVPSSQLPSYVDDVIDGYYNEVDGKFYEESTYTTEIIGESGKIYISVDTDIQYRWTGSAFAALGGALQLGETASTAYRGDRGKIAYDHSQIKDGSNPHETKADAINLKVPIPALSGSKLDVESTLYGINTALGKKADKVSSATSGHLAGLDSNGNLTDSGIAANKVIEKVTTATGLLKDDGTVDTTSYQPLTLSVPISTLGGTKLTVEDTLNEFNTEIKAIDTDLDGKADLTDLAPTFDNTVAYSKGQYVSYNGDVYKFTADHAIGAWIGTDATQVTFSSEIIGTTHNYDFDGVIPENSDLDNFTTLGNYSCAGTTAQTLANCPTTLAFSLEVSYRKDTPTYTTLPTVQQIIKNVNSTNSLIYYRTKVYNGSWTEWKSLATNKDLPYHKEISIVGSTTTTTYKNVYIKISGIPTANNSSTKAISLLLGTRSSRYILNINPYYNSNSLRILQAIDLSRASDTPTAAKIVDLAYEFSDTTAVGTMDVWLKIYLNAYATRLNFSDISANVSIPYDIVSLGNDNDIYDAATSTTNGDYFDALTTKGIISVISYGLDWTDAT